MVATGAALAPVVAAKPSMGPAGMEERPALICPELFDAVLSSSLLLAVELICSPLFEAVS